MLRLYHDTQNDSHLCDDNTRWWSLCHKYKDVENNVLTYDARVLFGPKRKPDPSKYIIWNFSVHLTDYSYYLHGSFNFDSHSSIIIAKQHIALTHWEYILTVCNIFSIVSPILSILTDVKVSNKKRKQRN